jgi:hypothetical protein
MARSYKYAVLTAVPNPRRGERVNVGIIVFRPDGFDVRFKQAEYKLRALTGEQRKGLGAFLSRTSKPKILSKG